MANLTTAVCVLEQVAPILSIGSSSLVAISTLTSEINFYTRLIKLKDPESKRCLFTVRSIELACEACKAAGIASSCVHMLHLVPRWHSEERHRKLKIMVVCVALLVVLCLVHKVPCARKRQRHARSPCICADARPARPPAERDAGPGLRQPGNCVPRRRRQADARPGAPADAHQHDRLHRRRPRRCARAPVRVVGGTAATL